MRYRWWGPNGSFFPKMPPAWPQCQCRAHRRFKSVSEACWSLKVCMSSAVPRLCKTRCDLYPFFCVLFIISSRSSCFFSVFFLMLGCIYVTTCNNKICCGSKLFFVIFLWFDGSHFFSCFFPPAVQPFFTILHVLHHPSHRLWNGTSLPLWHNSAKAWSCWGAQYFHYAVVDLLPASDIVIINKISQVSSVLKLFPKIIRIIRILEYIWRIWRPMVQSSRCRLGLRSALVSPHALELQIAWKFQRKHDGTANWTANWTDQGRSYDILCRLMWIWRDISGDMRGDTLFF